MQCNVCNKCRKLKKNSNIIYLKKTLSLSIVYCKVVMNMKKIFKEVESVELLKILGLINHVEEYQKIYNHA